MDWYHEPFRKTIADEPFIFVVRPKESGAKGFSRMLVVVPFDMFGTHLQYLTMCRLHICMCIYIYYIIYIYYLLYHHSPMSEVVVVLGLKSPWDSPNT